MANNRTDVVEMRALAPEELPAWVPAGWKVEVRIRKHGRTAGAKDKYYSNPTIRRQFRSKEEIIRYFSSSNAEKQLAGGCTPNQRINKLAGGSKTKQLAGECTTKQLASEFTAYNVSPFYSSPIIGRQFHSNEEIIRYFASENSEKQLAGECPSKQLAGECTAKQIAGDCTIKQLAGKCATKQLAGECAAKQLAGECTINQVAGECATKQLAGECTTKQLAGECTRKQLAGECTRKQLAGECATKDVSPLVLRKEGLPEWLPQGWIVEVRTRRSGPTAGQQYKIYVDPSSGHKFYSKNEVCSFLHTREVKSRTYRRKKRSQNELSSVNPPHSDQEHRFVTSRARRCLFGSYNIQSGILNPEMKGFTATHVTNSCWSIGFMIAGDTAQVGSSTFHSAIQEKPFNRQMVKVTANFTQDEKLVIEQKEEKVGSQNQKHLENGFSDQLVTRKPHYITQKTEDKGSLENLISHGSLELPIQHKPETVIQRKSPINGAEKCNEAEKCKLGIQEKFSPDPVAPCVVIGDPVQPEYRLRLQNGMLRLDNGMSHGFEKHNPSDNDTQKIYDKGLLQNGFSPGFLIEKSVKDRNIMELEDGKGPETAAEKHKTDCPKVPIRQNKNDKATILPCRTSKRLAGLEPELVTRLVDPEQALRRFSVRRTNQEAIIASKCNESSMQSGDSTISKVNSDCKVLTEESATKKQSFPLAFPFGDSWSDPCLEFAYKTLTDVISVDSILPNGLLFQ